MFSKLEY